MARKTDRETAEAAKETFLEEQGWNEYSIHLCPACNEPEFADDIDPTMFVDRDRTAFQISPAEILDVDPDNPWDHICVTAEKMEHTEKGEILRIKPHMHDYSMGVYQAWQEEVEEIQKHERRKQQNQELGDFASAGDGGAD